MDTNGQNDFAEVHRRGFEAFEKSDWVQALDCFESAAILRPDNVAAVEMLANTLGNMERFEESLEAYERLHQLGHECASCCHNEWIACRQLGRYRQGLAALERLLEFDPKDAEGWMDRGLILGGWWRDDDSDGEEPVDKPEEPVDENYEEAVASFEKVLALDPTRYHAWVCKGVLWHRLAGPARARAIAAPDGVSEWAEYKKCLQESWAAFDKAIALNPDDPTAWYQKGVMLVDFEPTRLCDEEADMAFEQVVDLQPLNADAWYKWAGVCWRLGETSTAVECLLSAIAINQEYAAWAKQDYEALCGEAGF